MAVQSFIFGKGQEFGSLEDLKKARAIADAMRGPQRAPQNVGEGLNAIGEALAYRMENARLNKAEMAGRESAGGVFDALRRSVSFPSAPSGAPAPSSPALSSAAVPGDLKSGIQATAESLGVDPIDLATAISYETAGTFSPTQKGPTTQWGQHRGLIQFGEPQAKKYGVNWDDPIGSQLGPEGAVAKYLRDTGVKPGMGLLDIYSAINAGGVGLYNRSDANNGGAPGTVRDKVEKQMAGHRAKALAMFAGDQAASADPSAGVAAALNRQGARSWPAEYGPEDVERFRNKPRPADAVPYDGPGSTFTIEGAQKMREEAAAREQASMDANTPPWMLAMIRQAQGVTPPPGSDADPNYDNLRPGSPELSAAAPVLPPPRTVAPVQVAQASEPDLSKLPVTAGGNAGVQQGPMLPPMETLLEAAGNPWLNEQERALVNTLLEQQMQQADPMRKLQIQKLERELNAPAGEAFTLGEGQIRFDAQGNPIARGGEKAENKPSAVLEYEYAKEQGFPGTFQDWEASKKGGMSLQVDPATGAVTFQQGSNIKPMTEQQSKDAVFSTRAEGALPLIDKYGDALTSLPETLGGQVPGVGNYMKSPEFQQAEQAGKEFLQAILRKDTGAAITPQETAEYGSVYLPRPGDSKEVLAQKKTSRTRALEAMKAGMPPQAILAQEKALAASGGTRAPEAPPDGIDPALWEVMTPEERALWN